MTTNKFSKYVIDNIVVGTPISSIIAAGATIGLDSAAVIDLIDSDYIQQRESSGLDSAEVIGLIDSDYVAARIPASNGAGLDSAATLDLLSYGIQNVGSNQKQVAISLNTFVDPFDQTGTADRSFNLNYTSTTGMFVRETGGRTEIYADASGTGQSTGLLLTGASFGNNGTEIAGNLKLSSLPTSDPSESGLLWNDGGIPVFSGSTAPIVSESLDSADVVGIVDSAYVQARETPQDFAYSSLTGAPTALSSFTNDTNYITAADIPATVDSDYVAARAPAASGGLDSAGVQGIVDDNILGGTANSGVVIGPSVSAASNRLQQTVVGPSAFSDAEYTVVMGRNARVESNYFQRAQETVAIGNFSRVGSSSGGYQSIAIGSSATSEKSYAVTIGANAVTEGDYGVSIGYQASADGDQSTALGYGARVNSGTSSVQVGRGTIAADNAIAISATGSSATTASTQYAIDIRTSDSGSVTYATDSDWVFGATVNAPAFVGDGSGLTGLPSGGGLDSAAVEAIIDSDLVGAESPNSYTMKIGANASRIAIGSGAVSTYVNSMSIGNNAGRYINGGSGQVVIGDAAGGAASGGAAHNIVAIGTNASTDLSATQYETVSIGYNAGKTNMGNYAVAIGSGASISSAGQMSIGLGYKAKASGSEAIAIGSGGVSGAKATESNTIAIGGDANATTQYGIDIRTSAAGSLTYDTTNDWTFGATVNAPAFVGDGSGLTGLPSGGGLDSAGVQSLIDAEVDATTLVLGTGTTAGIRVGSGATAATLSGGGIAIGQNSNATGSQAIAIGYYAQGDNNSVAIGISTETSGNSVSIGRSAITRVSGVAVGMSSETASNATAIGYNAKAGNNTFGTGSFSVAVGKDAYSQYNHSMHINSAANLGTGPSAVGGIVIESTLGRLEYSATADWVFNAGVTMTDLTASGATVVFNNLPTVDPVNAGQLWNDGGTLKVSAG
ncbi:hypothetical protein N9A42_00010 [bacterium]|nr:hypothetical protein [bacterium]